MGIHSLIKVHLYLQFFQFLLVPILCVMDLGFKTIILCLHGIQVSLFVQDLHQLYRIIISFPLTISIIFRGSYYSPHNGDLLWLGFLISGLTSFLAPAIPSLIPRTLSTCFVVLLVMSSNLFLYHASMSCKKKHSLY